jgi:hypothetical protein
MLVQPRRLCCNMQQCSDADATATIRHWRTTFTMQRATCAVQNGNHSGNHTGGRRGRWPQRSCASTHKQARTNKHAQTNTHKPARTNKHARTNTQRARQAQRAPRVRQLAVLHGRRHSRCGMLPPRAASRRRRGAVGVHRQRRTAAADRVRADFPANRRLARCTMVRTDRRTLHVARLHAASR